MTDPKPRGRIVRWVGCLFAAVLLVLLFLLGGAAYLRHREASRWPPLAEIPPIDIPAAPLPGDERAWEILVEAAAAHDDSVDWRAALSPAGPPADRDRGLWHRDVAAHALLEQAVARPGLTIPYPENYLDDFPNLLPYQNLARSRCLRGWDRALDGDLEGGVEEMLFPMGLGQRFLDCETALLPAMVGIAIQGIALDELTELMDTEAAETPEALAHAAGALLSLSESPPALSRALAWECATAEEVFRGDLAALAGYGAGGIGGSPPAQEFLFSLGYDADTTIAWHRSRCRQQVVQGALPWPRREEVDFEPLWPGGDRPSAGQLLHDPVGRIMIEIAMPDYGSFVEREDRLRARQRGHALAWAARAYALDHDGHPPLEASELVPDYIDHLPLDPFAEQPLLLEDGRVFSAAHQRDRIVGEIADFQWSVVPPTVAPEG